MVARSFHSGAAKNAAPAVWMTRKKRNKPGKSQEKHRSKDRPLQGVFGFGGKAVVADAAHFGAGDGDPNVAIAGDLLLELFVEAGFEFADFAATETGDVDVISRAVSFVVMAVTAEMEKIKFVDEALPLEEVDGAVDGDEVDVMVDVLGPFEDLVDVEMLLGAVHDLEDDAALACEPDAALAQGLLEMAGGVCGIDALTGRDATGGSGGHKEIVQREVFSLKLTVIGKAEHRSTGHSHMGTRQAASSFAEGSCHDPSTAAQQNALRLRSG